VSWHRGLSDAVRWRPRNSRLARELDEAAAFVLFARLSRVALGEEGAALRKLGPRLHPNPGLA
jgi:hypothetical protein